MLAINTASTYPEIQLLYIGSMTPDEICYKVYWLAMIDPCVADSPENLLSPLKRLVLIAYTTKVILAQSYWEVYLLAFLCRRGAVFRCQGRSQTYLMMGLDRMDLDREDRLIITI
jgi:hypothetical protein